MQNDNDSGTRTDKKATIGDALHDLARAGAQRMIEPALRIAR